MSFFSNIFHYKVPARRLVDAAQNLVDDIHTELPNKKMDLIRIKGRGCGTDREHFGFGSN